MSAIVDAHYPGLKQELVTEALAVFYGLREIQGLKKKPSTSELLDWLRLLVLEDVPGEALKQGREGSAMPPMAGALLKNEQDVARVAERLTRGHGRGRW